jgi:Arc/MetJ-type ribon-helix-helix transcriptional regulator
MTEKRAISLPDEDAAWLDKKVTAGEVSSFSAGLAELVAAARQREAWLAREAEAFGEPLPDDPEREDYWAARLCRSAAEVLDDNAHDAA